jgi:undecaprenyl-diphosphatase
MAASVVINRIIHWRGSKTFFAFISRLGDGVFWYSLALVLPFLYGAEALVTSLHLVVLGLVSIVIYKRIKAFTERSRPCDVNKQITKGTAPLDQYSFPSGHTMHAVAFTFIVTSSYPELAWILVPFTLLVSASRIILGLHYPTDVFAGGIIGVLIAIISQVFQFS